MYFYVLFDIFMGMCMFLFGLYFYRSNGKAARLLSGYNMRPESERRKYDENKMCRKYGAVMMVMSVPFVIGCIIDLFNPGIGYIVPWALWTMCFVFLIVLRSKTEK